MSLNRAPKNNVFYRNNNWHYPKIERGEGSYLYGEDGKKYLDGCSGSAVANIGHGNKEIAEFAKEQIEKIAFTHLSRWTADSIEQCAERVARWAPLKDSYLYFLSSGSEASETAIKLARQYYVERDGSGTSKWKVISKWNSFHGNTLGALSLTGITGRRKIYDPMLINFPKIPQFYHYRNMWDAETLEKTSIKAAYALEEEILRQGADNIAAFISEPVVGSAAPGAHPTKIYFEIIRKICDKYDILFIDDEVMAGFGRTGENFAINHFGGECDSTPDIIVTGKGMGCGYTPIAAAIVSDKIHHTIMTEGTGLFIHGHTYAANPLSCGIANKVLEIVERDNCVENAKIQGKYLFEKLQDLYKYPIIGDIRGKGLMIGVEIVEDKKTKTPFDSSKNVKGKLTQKCLDEGLVIYPGGGSVDGKRGDHFLLAPPLNITKEQVDELLFMLDAGVKKICDELV